jgi:hypothetical protein
MIRRKHRPISPASGAQAGLRDGFEVRRAGPLVILDLALFVPTPQAQGVGEEWDSFEASDNRSK